MFRDVSLQMRLVWWVEPSSSMRPTEAVNLTQFGEFEGFGVTAVASWLTVGRGNVQVVACWAGLE